jgi:hypothetical protein
MSRLTGPRVSYGLFELQVERWRKLDHGLKDLAVMATATVGGQPVAVLTLAVADGHITAIQLLANPDKLSAIAAGRTLPL